MSEESVDPKSEEKPEPVEIWTPPEKLDANVQRMAWLLFMEHWKGWVDIHGRDNKVSFPTTMIYEECLTTAKVVREAELKAGGQ
jgi:hypothetical protein